MEEPVEDFGRYYDLNSYLFTIVGPKFRETGRLDAFDFFCIVIWKANRAKSRIAALLRKHGTGTDLETLVDELTSEIAKQPDARAKLHYFIKVRKFSLPMASAILTVFYPNEFTVFDRRVSRNLFNARPLGSEEDFRSLSATTNFQKQWDGYQRFVIAVRQAAPVGLSLRDKDRWLWGKDFHKQLFEDIGNGFRKPPGALAT